jgi:hypothetical protein
VFVELQGAAKSPFGRGGAPLKSLKGPGAAAVVRALCDYRPPYTVSQLARGADLPVASVFRVVDGLLNESLVEKASPRGQIVRPRCAAGGWAAGSPAGRRRIAGSATDYASSGGSSVAMRRTSAGVGCGGCARLRSTSAALMSPACQDERQPATPPPPMTPQRRAATFRS